MTGRGIGNSATSSAIGTKATLTTGSITGANRTTGTITGATVTGRGFANSSTTGSKTTITDGTVTGGSLTGRTVAGASSGFNVTGRGPTTNAGSSSGGFTLTGRTAIGTSTGAKSTGTATTASFKASVNGSSGGGNPTGTLGASRATAAGSSGGTSGSTGECGLPVDPDAGSLQDCLATCTLGSDSCVQGHTGGYVCEPRCNDCGTCVTRPDSPSGVASANSSGTGGCYDGSISGSTGCFAGSGRGSEETGTGGWGTASGYGGFGSANGYSGFGSGSSSAYSGSGFIGSSGFGSGSGSGSGSEGSSGFNGVGRATSGGSGSGSEPATTGGSTTGSSSGGQPGEWVGGSASCGPSSHPCAECDEPGQACNPDNGACFVPCMDRNLGGESCVVTSITEVMAPASQTNLSGAFIDPATCAVLCGSPASDGGTSNTVGAGGSSGAALATSVDDWGIGGSDSLDAQSAGASAGGGQGSVGGGGSGSVQQGSGSTGGTGSCTNSVQPICFVERDAEGNPIGCGSMNAVSCVWVNQEICAMGRRVEGVERGPRLHTMADYMASASTLEAVSIPAFRRLERDLATLGAPDDLLRRARVAARDEIRHTRTMTRLARKHGTGPRSVRLPPYRMRTAMEIAEENMVEGCVRETFGAALALWQSRHAHDPELAEAMVVIAEEEADHAQLAADVSEFLQTLLTADERRQLMELKEAAICDLADGMRVAPAYAEEAGFPDPSTAQELIRSVRRQVWN